MYKEFFRLKAYPFQLTPDSGFLYMSEAHTRAKAYMDYTIWNNDGFMVITGEVGSGKTTLIRQLLSELDDTVVVAKLFQTQLNETEFLQAVLVEFGLNPFNAKKVELLDMLNTFLIEAHSRFKQTILIVDEAQNLPIGVLEEIRMLSGLETEKEKLLNVILVGQPELNDALNSPEMEQLLQRVRLRYHIRALLQKETEEYIIHRLKIAGAESLELFEHDSIPLIYKYTGGVPRLINTLCDTALTCAYADELKTVSTAVIQSALEELQWPTYEERLKEKALKKDAGRNYEKENNSAPKFMQDYMHALTQNMIQLNEKIDNVGDLSKSMISVSKSMELMNNQLKTLIGHIATQVDDKKK